MVKIGNVDEFIKLLIVSMREEFPTRIEFDELRGEFRALQQTMDGVIKRFDVFETEMRAMNHRVGRLEKHTGLI